MNNALVELPLASPRPVAPKRSVAKKRARIIKKIRATAGGWKFISPDRIGNRYIWDKRPGHYFLEWWDVVRRRRMRVGDGEVFAHVMQSGYPATTGIEPLLISPPAHQFQVIDFTGKLSSLTDEKYPVHSYNKL